MNKTKTIHIWHHNDNDGRCAAYIARMAMEHKHQIKSITFYEMTYDKITDFSEVQPEDICIIVDFSFKKEVMQILLDTKAHVIWIDHHKYAIEALKDVRCPDGTEISGLRRTTDSASLLAWEYFKIAPFIMPPYAVRLVDDYDAWKHKLPEDIDFLRGSELFDCSPAIDHKSNFWTATIIDGTWKHVANQGRIINLHQKEHNKSKLKAIGWVGMLRGFDRFVLCLNGMRGSQSFESCPHPFDVLCAYEHKGNMFTVSLYSNRGVDVSELAKQFGGGGHAGAAGFVCRELPIMYVEPYTPDTK
jgi:oligoribonuclease NrnB/cAMP/cGMP phosphodiesterase (DHH superfamily)